MGRFAKPMSVLLLLMATASSGWAFSMLGPFEAWQVTRIGYNLPFNADIGAPKNLGEEYRWNIRTITYGFDSTFLNFFGQRGADEVRKAIAILNALPPYSAMSSNLEEFQLDTRRFNFQASALSLIDIKSYMLAILVEEMGLAGPERFTWTLRLRRATTPPTYVVVTRNFDPVTWEPTSYVNGQLLTFGVYEFPGPPIWPVEFADAVEFPVDPESPGWTSVAGYAGNLFDREQFFPGTLPDGMYFTGLTRDDVGGLRYLYRKQNYNVENLLLGTTVSSGSPLSPFTSGGTNNVDVALRPGVDKITFVEGKYESGLGPFISVTNRYVDYYVTNNQVVKQYTERAQLFTPDIVFAAADLLLSAYARTDTSGWTNNAALNGQVIIGGPGLITPTITITLNKFVPTFDQGAYVGLWGAFDGTTNAPYVFPSGISISDLERRVLGH